MKKNLQYPADIKPLTSLRFIAAFWLLIYFFWPRLDLGLYFPNIVKNGYLGVDLFFILSGFILAHVYGPQVENKTYNHKKFIWARLARIYPVHILCFLGVFIIWFVGLEIGASFEENAFSIKQIPFHLTLTHAWGFLKSDGWNFPSWSISAEWFAYLTFPITFFVANSFKNKPYLGLLFTLSIFYALYFITNHYGFEFTDMSWNGGALRIIPSFMAGINLWFIGRTIDIGIKQARIGVLISVLLIVLISSFLHLPYLIWPCLLALIFFLAETSKHKEKAILSSKTWVYLGEISFAMYMIHLPIDIAAYQIIDRLNINSLYLKIGAMIVVLIITILAAMIINKYFEKPIRDYLRKNTPNFIK